MRLLNHIIDFLIPPRCVCGQVVSQDELLCYECWPKLEPVIYCCPECGLPYQLAIHDVCGTCQLLKGRSAFFYNDFTKDWLMRLKYGDQTHIAKKMAYWMTKRDPMFFQNIDMIMPVPIHFWRLLKRRYNQSALIANHIGKIWHKLVVHNVLVKQKNTSSQGHLAQDERLINVQNSFAVKKPQLICNKHILLIDDVITTGSTLQECTKILYDQGALSVKYLVFAYRLCDATKP